MTGIILLYHRVAEASVDPHSLCVDPHRFAGQLRVLRDHAPVVGLGDLPRAAGAVAITFDDGYRDNVERAAGMLVDAAVPATFFITSGAIGGGEEFWWDTLERLLLDRDSVPVPALEVEVAGRHLWADVRTATARQRAYDAVYWRLRSQPPATICGVLEAVAGQLGDPRGVREDRLPMSWAQLRDLERLDGMSIGAHTVTHPWLPTQDPQTVAEEVTAGKAELERRLDIAVTAFAYPFGGHDPVAEAAVAAAGMDRACTTAKGVVRRRTAPLRLPRMVVGNWDSEEFSARLRAWSIGRRG